MNIIRDKAQDIVNRYNAGETVASIAKSLNVRQETINKLLVGDTFKGKYKAKEKDYRNSGRKIIMQINGRNIPFDTVRALAKVLELSEPAISNMLAGRHPIPIIEDIRYA